MNTSSPRLKIPLTFMKQINMEKPNTKIGFAQEKMNMRLALISNMAVLTSQQNKQVKDGYSNQSAFNCK